MSAIRPFRKYNIRPPHTRPIPKQIFEHSVGLKIILAGTKATTSDNQHIRPIATIGVQRTSHALRFPNGFGPYKRVESYAINRTPLKCTCVNAYYAAITWKERNRSATWCKAILSFMMATHTRTNEPYVFVMRPPTL